MHDLKKTALILFIFLTLFFAGCSSTDHIITDNALDYVYKANDKINFYDNEHSRELLGSLTVVSMNVLSSDTFVIKVPEGFDENDEPVYREETYNQLVQINYAYHDKKGNKVVNESNFRVYDCNNSEGKNNPKIPYTEAKIEGMSSFVVALRTHSDTISVKFSYNGNSSYDAKIQLNIEDNSTSYSESADAPKSDSDLKTEIQKQVKEIESLKSQLEDQNKVIDGQKSELNHLNLIKSRNTTAIIICGGLIAILLITIITLICASYIKTKRLKKQINQ